MEIVIYSIKGLIFQYYNAELFRIVYSSNLMYTIVDKNDNEVFISSLYVTSIGKREKL